MDTNIIIMQLLSFFSQNEVIGINNALNNYYQVNRNKFIQSIYYLLFVLWSDTYYLIIQFISSMFSFDKTPLVNVESTIIHCIRILNIYFSKKKNNIYDNTRNWYLQFIHVLLFYEYFFSFYNNNLFLFFVTICVHFSIPRIWW